MSGSYDLPAAHVAADGRVHEQGARRRRVPLLVPRDRGLVPDRAPGAERRVRARTWTRPTSARRTSSRRTSSRTRRRPGSSTTPATTRPRWTWRWRRSATTSSARSRRPRAPRASSTGSALASFTEVVGAGPHKDYDIIGLKMNDGAELRIHPTGKAILKISVPDAGPGPRDHVRADRGRGARDPARGHQGDARRHGQHAVRAGHLRLALDAGVGRGHRDGRRAASGEKATKLAAHLLEVAEEDIEFEAGKFSVKGAPDKVKTIQDVAFAAYTNFPEGMEAGPGGRLLLRPAEPDVPVRDVRRRGRGRPRHRRVEGAADGRGRRLRRADQPDDRRGPDPRRAHRGLRRSRRWS